MTNVEPANTAGRGRARLSALALLTAAIAILGGVVPTTSATAAGESLILTIDSTYAMFPTVTVAASDGTTVNAVTITAENPDFGFANPVTCTSTPCSVQMPVPSGGNWTFTATSGASSGQSTKTISDWSPTYTSNNDATATLHFPATGGSAASYYYTFVSPGHSSVVDHTTESTLTLDATLFDRGAQYTVYLGYDVAGVAGPLISMLDFIGALPAPNDFVATAGIGKALMTWSAPVGISSTTEYSFIVRRHNVNSDEWKDFPLSNTTFSLDLPLDNGSVYELKVLTTSGGYDQGFSPVITVAPIDIPATAASITVTAGDGSGVVDANFPTDAAHPSAASNAIWEISKESGAFGPATMNFTTSPITVTGLENGKNYVLRATSKNGAGVSAGFTDSASFKPVALPAVPVIDVPIAGDGSVSVVATFVSPSDSPATGQVWEISTMTDDEPDEWVETSPTEGPTSTFTFAGLANGTFYRVHVKSTGPTGSSAWSESASVRPFGGAPMPTISSVGRGDGTVNAAASFNSSLAQPSTSSDATWQLKSEGAIINSADLTMDEVDGRFVFSGLTNGSAYQIRVRGSNDHGLSDWTAWSDFISPASAPATLTLTPDGMSDGALTVTFPVASAAAPVTSIVWQIGTVDENGDVSWAPVVPVIDGTTASFPGLTPGTTYVVKATPSNDVGTGPESTSDGQLFIAVPSKPVILIAGAQKTGLLVALEPAIVDVAKPTVGYIWEVARVAGPAAGIWEPASASVLDGFIIDNEGANVPVPGGYAITGLINGVRYNLHVAAINGAGRSAWAAWNPVLTPASGITTGTVPAADNTTVAGDDSDGDGIPNAIDPDVDGDSIPNPFDPDIDGDGIANLDDDDRDGDGLINPLDETPNGIGNASDHADDWVDPVIPTALTTAGVTTDADDTLPASGTTDSTAPVVNLEGDVAAVLSVRFPYPVGHQARGMTVYSAGRGLMPGSEYTLVLHSTPTTLGHGSVDSSGTIQFTSTMPSAVSAGKHELVLTAVGASGKTVSKTLTLRIGKDGMLRPVNATSSSGSSGGSANDEILHEDNSLRVALIVGAVILWLLILAAAIWAAIILRRRRDDDEEELDVPTLNLFDDEPVGTR
ncbi:hypothetical protein BH09ACT1_BH09ACT1_00780 [soil metagenome]